MASIRPRVLRGGSSPLARGLPAGASAVYCQAWIIPARAGFTQPRASMSSGGPDHPRSRGVYKGEFYPCKPDVGSSPLARGLPAVGGLDDPIVRIIPARAGFTGRQPVRRRPGWDHPRSRGVYLRVARCTGPALGSSPLARGLQSWYQRTVKVAGIIPARAGFTAGAHVIGRTQKGSSPLARGLHDEREPSSHLWGIIPARAGLTLTRAL